VRAGHALLVLASLAGCARDPAMPLIQPHENKRTHTRHLQIEVERASQIRLSAVPGLSRPRALPERP
jgi:hypothetical protein